MPAEALALVFAASFSIGLSGAMSPGPVTVFVMSQGARLGAQAGPLVALGHALLEFTLVILLWLGLARLFQQQVVVGVMALIGGLVMMWMGWQTVAEVRRHGASLHVPAAPLPGPGPILGGAVLSLSNPFWTLWWATIGISTMGTLAVPLGVPGLVAFAVGHVSSDFAWFSLVALIVATGKRFISDRAYQLALYVLGSGLALFGLYFLWRGIRLVA